MQMDLHLLSDDERRALCRRELEALELWLRRLIHEAFSAAHGAEYLDAVDRGGRLIKKQVAGDIADRRAKEPLRYHRPVDAAHLDDLVTVLCNPQNWRHYFGAALSGAFPLGNEEARTFFGRLVGVRNKLSHANPISVHEAARVICYTLDVIEALKGYYMNGNLENEYNVPMIIRVTDSFGNVFDVSGLRGDQEFTTRTSSSLRPGDRLSIEIEIAPSFERSSYCLKWGWSRKGSGEEEDSERIVIEIENRRGPHFCSMVRSGFDQGVAQTWNV
jgi:Swt1-like HEPN